MTNNTGRPTKMTPETISKLEHAFSLGCSDLEALRSGPQVPYSMSAKLRYNHVC
jgi:hypothetical protein